MDLKSEMGPVPGDEPLNMDSQGVDMEQYPPPPTWFSPPFLLDITMPINILPIRYFTQ